MIDRFFHDATVIARLRSSALGRHLEGLAALMQARGYSAVTAQSYIRAAGHFAHWLGVEGVPVDGITQQVMDHFVGQHLRECSCSVPFGGPPSALRAVLPLVRTVLAAAGLLPGTVPSKPTAVDLRMGEFAA